MTVQKQHADPEQAAVTRARLVLIAVVLPVVVACASSVLIVSWMPTLPAQIAMHWGPGGVDGVGSPWQLVGILLGTVVLCAGVNAFSVGDLAESGRPRVTQKVLASASLWLAVLLGIGIAGSIAVQRGLDDALDAPDPAPWLLLGAVVGFLAAAGAWFVLPQADRTPPRTIETELVELGHSERALWTGTVSVARSVAVLIGTVIVLLIGGIVASALAGADWVILGATIVIPVVALALSTVRWRMSVGSTGASLVSFAGWPSVRIPLSDISATRLITVNPVGDFGGWGWRWSTASRTGVIMQSGPAVEVTCTNGKVLVVPIDDAATAVAVLQAALAQRTGV